MFRARIITASASIAIIVTVVLAASALAPDGARPLLLVSAALATITGVQSVASDPRDIGLALLFSLAPIAALVLAGSPVWLVAPLAALLLLASELNALSWECQGTDELSAVRRRRLGNVGRLGALALAGAMAVGIATSLW